MGKPVRFSDITHASPKTIWDTCISNFQWEAWDHDVQQLSDVSGKCVAGTTFTFDMKDGSQIPVTLTEVNEHKFISYKGTIAGGSVQIQSTISFEPMVDTDSNTSNKPQTRVTYQFAITGILGPVVNFLKWKMIVDGTKTGLANIIRLSEDAEKGNHMNK